MNNIPVNNFPSSLIFFSKMLSSLLSLFTIALHFRLLRKHGYDVSSNVFEKLKDEDNKFKKDIIGDIEGLLSLYDASYLRYHDENILEEAMIFTRNYLKEAKLELDSYLQEKVARALEVPIHKGVEIVEARYYISTYEKKETKNELLLTLARLHFNLLQNLYQKEIDDLSKWWKEMNITSKLPYMRDRVVECFFWAMAITFEYEHSLSRVTATKGYAMMTFMNDTYDNYATHEESENFTEILERWDIGDIDQLPNYMKIAYTFIFDTYKDYDQEMSKQGRPYAASSFIEFMKQYARALYKKSKCYYMGQEIPTFQDYMSSDEVTIVICDWMLALSLMGMKSASKKDLDVLKSEPKIVETTALYSRYMNDRSTYEREHASGQYPVAVDCYMKENGLSKEETLDKFLEFAEDKWKTMNKEMTLNCTPSHMKKLLLNFARIVHFTYDVGEDKFTNPEKGFTQVLTALFVNPILT